MGSHKKFWYDSFSALQQGALNFYNEGSFFMKK